MSALVSLSSSFTASLLGLYATTVFATEDSNNKKFLNSFHWAGGNSTYSFGLYQYDVGANTGGLAQSFLLDNGFSKAEVVELSQHGGLSKATLTALNTQLAALLATNAGAEAIAALNSNWFNDILEPEAQKALNIAVRSDTTIASQLLSSPVAIQHLLDLINQFGANSTLFGFLAGKSVKLPNGGNTVTWNPNSSPDQNIESYILATHYSLTHMDQELGRENRFYAAISGETIIPTQIEISAGTGNDSNSVTLDQLQNTTVTLDAGIALSVGSLAPNIFNFTSNNIIYCDAPYSNNGTIFGAVAGDYVDFKGVSEAQILNFPSVSDPTFEFESSDGQIGSITIGDWVQGDGFGAGDLLGNGDLAIEVLPPLKQNVSDTGAGHDVSGPGFHFSEFRNAAHVPSVDGYVSNHLLHF